jgi:integrase
MDTTERFLISLRARTGRSGKPLAGSTIHAYGRMIHDLYVQRVKLSDAPGKNPFPGERRRPATGYRPQSGRTMPYTPDPIAVPLVAAALRLLGPPANDVIALRDLAQSAFEAGLAAGIKQYQSRVRACRAMRGVTFATLLGDEAPWHVPVTSPRTLRFLVDRVADACFVVIAYLVGARASEILSLEPGCIERRATADGSEVVAYLGGRIFKTAAGHNGAPHRWVAPEPVVRAIDILDQLSAPLRERNGEQLLWLTTHSPGPGLITGRATIAVPSAGAITARLNKHFAPFVGLPAHDGRPWRLTTHQGRKTFARFVGKRDRTGLHALQAHLGHVSRIMTDRGYVGTDFELAELVDAQALDETRAALEELLTASRLAGRAGRRIAQRSRFRGRTRDGDVRAYVAHILAETEMRLGVCDWGYCVYRRESSACVGDAAGPNPVLRTESTCASCANFAVTERHRPVWEARRRRNVDLLAHPALDPESRALARERVAESERILAELDTSRTERDHGPA